MGDRPGSVLSVGPESSLSEALGVMRENGVKHVVVALDGRPVGVVTARDAARFLGDGRTAGALDEVPVKHVMQKSVITVPEGSGDRHSQCAARMEAFGIGAVVLVDDRGMITGIVTKTDITREFAAAHGGRFKVGEFMSRGALTCRGSDTVRFAADVMNRNRVSRLVVTDESGVPVGVITTGTLLHHTEYFSGGLPESGADVSRLTDGGAVTAPREGDLAAAAGLMISNKISGLPVTDPDGSLAGVTSTFDVVRAFVAAGTRDEIKHGYGEQY
ncbi:CBS domain [Cenarchaeum symbiosum A]|uniref:CBS domain n=1 Tax=Cenarchaeum symbiosum (strain A) TaxID=414004 RepID=A0RYL5_CENSY|nr:CBS domain [Cenarchaeum symbiosum A]